MIKSVAEAVRDVLRCRRGRGGPRRARGAAARGVAEMQPVERRVLLAAVGVSNVVVDEGARAAVTVSLDGAVGRDVTVRYATADGSARGRVNYVPKRGTAVIRAGETSAQFFVKANRDGTYAGTKQFRVVLGEPKGAELGKAFSMVRVRNTDPAPVVKLATPNPKLARPAAGVRGMTFVVRVQGKSELPLKVKYATQNGTAVAGRDYVRRQGVLTFAPGQANQQQRVTVTIRGAKGVGPHEVFAVNLSNVQNGRLGRAMAAGTILGSAKMSEGNVVVAGPDVSVVGGSEAGVRVSLNQMPATPVTVNYWTVDGTAVGGTDYTPVSGTLTFRPGETEKVIGVGTGAREAGGEEEVFTVGLSAGKNVTVADGSRGVTITAAPDVIGPGPVPGEITGEGIAFSPSSEWAWVVNYFENLKFNYVLNSTRAVQPAGLRMELFVAPKDADLRGYAAFRSAPVTAGWGADGVLRGTIDASGAVIPEGATGLWQIHARLVDAGGLVYGRYGSFLLRV